MAETKVVVPEGHAIDVTVAQPLPRVTVRPGGAWIAQLGLGSDAADTELDAVIAEVEALIAAPRPRVIVAQVNGHLQELFAPSDPAVMPVDGLLAWVIDADALASTPLLAGRFMDQLRKHALPQTVFVRESASERSRAMIAAIQAAHIGVRELEPPDAPILVEVSRPGGVILTALAGKPCPALPIGGLPGGVVSVARAPRLRALLLGVADAGRAALYAELSARQIPLVAIGHLTGAVQLRTWPDGFTALPVYADRMTLVAAARAQAMPPASFSIVEMIPRALFAWASKQGFAVAINYLDDDGQARHIPIDPGDVRTLGA